MKRLVFPSVPGGGHPIKLKNLRHLQEGIYESFTALCKGFGTNFILWGCEFTYTTTTNPDDTLNWTAGAVVLSGEICLIDAGSLLDGGSGVFKFAVADSNADVAPQVYADASSHNVHFVRKATVVEEAIGTANPLIIIDRIEDVYGGKWSEVTVSSYKTDDDPTTTWTVSSGNELVKAHVVNKKVTINVDMGGSTLSGSGAAALRIQLPAEYESAMTAIGSAHVAALGTAKAAYCKISSGQRIIEIRFTDGTNMPTSLLAVNASITFEID